MLTMFTVAMLIAQDRIQWSDSYEEALRSARMEGKPVILFFNPCSKALLERLSSQEQIRLSRHFVLIQTSRTKYRRKYRVRSGDSVAIFLDPNGKEVGRQRAFALPDPAVLNKLILRYSRVIYSFRLAIQAGTTERKPVVFLVTDDSAASRTLIRRLPVGSLHEKFGKQFIWARVVSPTKQERMKLGLQSLPELIVYDPFSEMTQAKLYKESRSAAEYGLLLSKERVVFQQKYAGSQVIGGRLQWKNVEGGAWTLKHGGKTYDLHDLPKGFKAGDEIEVTGTVWIDFCCIHMVGPIFRVQKAKKINK